MLLTQDFRRYSGSLLFKKKFAQKVKGHGPTRPPYSYGPGSFEAPHSFSYDQLSEIFRSVFRFEGKLDEIWIPPLV